MDTSEAMSVLLRSGRGADEKKLVEEAVAAAQAEYRAIEEDETRTAEYKRAEIQRVYESRRARLNEKLVELAQSASRVEHQDAIKVFGTADLPGDTASLTIGGMRLTGSPQSEIRGSSGSCWPAPTDPETRCSRGPWRKGPSRTWTSTLNAFLADRPRLNEAAQRLSDAVRSESTGQRFQHTLLLSGLRPPEYAR